MDLEDFLFIHNWRSANVCSIFCHAGIDLPCAFVAISEMAAWQGELRGRSLVTNCAFRANMRHGVFIFSWPSFALIGSCEEG